MNFLSADSKFAVQNGWNVSTANNSKHNFFPSHHRVVEKAMTTATKVFLDACISIEMNQSYLADLNELIRKEIEILERNNSEVSTQKCKAILNGLWEPLESKMNESFVLPGEV